MAQGHQKHISCSPGGQRSKRSYDFPTKKYGGNSLHDCTFLSFWEKLIILFLFNYFKVENELLDQFLLVGIYQLSELSLASMVSPCLKIFLMMTNQILIGLLKLLFNYYSVPVSVLQSVFFFKKIIIAIIIIIFSEGLLFI